MYKSISDILPTHKCVTANISYYVMLSLNIVHYVMRYTKFSQILDDLSISFVCYTTCIYAVTMRQHISARPHIEKWRMTKDLKS